MEMLLSHLKERSSVLMEGVIKYLENTNFVVGRQLAPVLEARVRVLGPLHVQVEAGLFYGRLGFKFTSVQQEKETLESQLQELIWEVEHLQAERDRQADSDAPLTEEGNAINASDLDAVSPNEAAVLENSFLEHYFTPVYSGAVLAQADDIVADILIACNLDVVSAMNATALPEDPVAQQHRPKAAGSGAVLTQQAVTATASDLEAFGPMTSAALPENSFVQQNGPTPAVSGAVLTQESEGSAPLTQQAVTATASNLDAVSPMTSAALPENSFAQQNGPTLAVSGAALTQEDNDNAADYMRLLNLEADSPVNAAALSEGSLAQQYQPAPDASTDGFFDSFTEASQPNSCAAHQNCTPAANPYEELLGILLHLLGAKGHAAVEDALAPLPLYECTFLITKALEYEQVELAVVIGELCLCIHQSHEAVLRTIANKYHGVSPDFISIALTAVHYHKYNMAVLLLGPALQVMPAQLFDGHLIAASLDVFPECEGVKCRTWLLTYAADVGQVHMCAAMVAAMLEADGFHEAVDVLLRLFNRGDIDEEALDAIILSMVSGAWALKHEHLPHLVEAFVDMGGRDKALRVLAVATHVNGVDSVAVKAVYRHISSSFALATKLFVGCAHLSGCILACLFERISEAVPEFAAKDFLVGLVSSVVEAATPVVLSTLLRKVLGPFFTARLAELLSPLVPNPEVLADTDFLWAVAHNRTVADNLRNIAAMGLAANLVAEAEVQDV